jgi:hypothetical protein
MPVLNDLQTVFQGHPHGDSSDSPEPECHHTKDVLSSKVIIALFPQTRKIQSRNPLKTFPYLSFG